jgi:alpha-amylase/alpha-mannosidase (GH57 family)
MEGVRSNQMAIRPISLSHFLAENPPEGLVDVQTGAWNVGWTSGYDFSQWAGSDSQRKALEAIWQLSRSYQECVRSFSADRPGIAHPALRRARECLLRAETSCYLFWGDAWIPKLYEEIRIAQQLLDEFRC